MVPEQNLLTGIFAVQLKFVTPQELVTAGSQWAADQEQDICTILLEQGTITAKQADLLRQLTEEQIQSNGGDASAALQTFGGNAAVQESFAASIIYEKDAGVRYRSVDRESPQPVERTERNLSVPGQLITEHPGRYTMRGEQGRGAVGRVLIAYDEHIGREIALKELLPDSAADKTPAADSTKRLSTAPSARFLREARITGQLEHPGILPVYELGLREDGNTYYTMKLVRGETLADRLRACRNIGDRLKLLPHFLDLCQAIAYAHSRGVIHRDIKPGNVMIGEFGETVLLDWGLAKVKGQKDEGAQKLADEVKLLKEAGASETVAGKPIGTPSYMSPEQADGRIEDIDERSDVWSLGAVLYEILTGKPPFHGTTALEVIGKVLNDEVTPVLVVQKDAPVELAAAAEKCLKRENRNRYLNVESIADDISAFLSGGIVSAYTYSTALLMQRWAKRNWAYIGAAGVVFLVLTVAILLLVSQNNVLVNRQVELLVRGLSASASSVRRERNDRWQTGMLLALQARRFEHRQFGHISGNTANTLREQLNDHPLGSIRLTGFEGAVGFVALSPDGKLLASAGDDGSVRVWQADELTSEPRVLTGYEGTVRQVAFSPDSSLLVSAGEDGAIRVWQADELTAEPQVLTGHEGAVQQVTFSPDGSLLVSAGEDGAIRVWQADELIAEPQVLTGHEGSVRQVAFSPDSSLLASAGEDETVRVWQVSDLTADPQVLKGQENAVSDLAFSPDGNLLASAGGDGIARVWLVGDLTTEPQLLTGHVIGVRHVSFSPDGSLLTSVDNEMTIRVWQTGDLTAKPQVLKSFKDADDSANGETQYSPDGKLLASAGDDGTVRVWQADDLAIEPLLLKGHEGPVEHISFSPDSSLLVSTGRDKTIRVWPLNGLTAEPQVLKGHSIMAWIVAFSPDSSLMATSGYGETVLVWQVSDLTAEAHMLKGQETAVRHLDFSPDGSLLAACGDDKTVRIWRVDDLTADPQVLEHEAEVFGTSFSPDGRLLVAIASDGSALAWQVDDLSAAPQVLKGQDCELRHFSFSREGNMLATAGADGAVRVWLDDCLTTEPLVLHGHEGDVRSVSFSRDGSLLASSGADKTVRVWHTDDLTAEPQVLRGHDAAVWALSFSPDGSLLASTSDDQTARVWRVADLTADPQVLRGIKGLVSRTSFSPDGSVLASIDRGGTVLVWQADDLTAEPQVLKGHDGVVWRTFFSPDGRLLATAGDDATIRVWHVDINAVTAIIENECFRNLSWNEWQIYVGKSVPYEKTIPELPLGPEVPYEGAIADKT